MVCQAVYRVRRKTQPKLPKSRPETHENLTDYNLISTNGEHMIQINNTETGIIMFTTQSNMEFFCKNDVEIFIDGTFKYCPKFYYQLYTFLGYKNGRYVPSVFCLLPAKLKESYKNMFKHLIDVAISFGLTLNLNLIHLGFEDAVFDAAREFWPDINIRGCHFHLSQAWWRKIQSLGLAVEYKTQDSVIGKWLKVFFGLSFLTPEEIDECFAFDIFCNTPDDYRTVAFADYIVHNYI